MIIVSNHLLKKTDINFLENNTVIRINVAWVKNKAELIELLNQIQNDIYLDYPQGRNKPPRPTLQLDEVMELIPNYDHIKHFAISNVEDPGKIFEIQNRLPSKVNLVPKIETQIGVENLEEIIDKIEAKYIMLDKEDLYIDVDTDQEVFENLIELARKTCKEKMVKILELQGVVFAPHE